jgi:hypothetical protein
MNINLRVVSIAVAVCIGMLGAVLLANPSDLGISPVAARWLGIIAVGLGILQGFLPKLQGPTTDPGVLADRVWSLPPEDRRALTEDLERRSRQAEDDDPVPMARPQAVRSRRPAP